MPLKNVLLCSSCAFVHYLLYALFSLIIHLFLPMSNFILQFKIHVNKQVDQIICLAILYVIRFQLNIVEQVLKRILLFENNLFPSYPFVYYFGISLPLSNGVQQQQQQKQRQQKPTATASHRRTVVVVASTMFTK